MLCTSMKSGMRYLLEETRGCYRSAALGQATSRMPCSRPDSQRASPSRVSGLRWTAGGGLGWPQLEAETAGDDEPLDLVRALPDLQHLLIAVEPRDRVLVHEPVPPVDLERGVHDPVRQLARVELCNSRRLRERAPFLLQPCGLVDEVPGRLDLRRHVGELELDRLELADGLSELLPLPRIRRRQVERALGQPEPHRRHRDPAAVENLKKLFQAGA